MTFNDEESLIKENGMTLGLEQLTEPKKSSRTEPKPKMPNFQKPNQTKNRSH